MAKESLGKFSILTNFRRGKKVLFVDTFVPDSVIAHFGVLFDRFVRAYAFCYIPIVVISFIVNEFVSKPLMCRFVIFHTCLLFVLVLTAYYYHCRLRDYIGTDVNKWIFITGSNCIDKRIDPISLIALNPLRIPPKIKTNPPQADMFLDAIQHTPFIHLLSWTIQDYKYLRFSWIKADKSEPENFIDSLEPSDCIMYHSNKSLIGWFIRFVTRCYWEHSGIYLGDGKVFDVAPGGSKTISIESWVLDDDIELAVLRQPMPALNKRGKQILVTNFCELHKTKGYNYYGILKEFWHILTNKKGDGFMKLHIFLVNTVMLMIVLITCYCIPELTRIQLFLIMIFMPYIVDTIYHWWAYKKQYDELDTIKLFERHSE